MSTAEFAAFSDNAIMFASIVYVLAFLGHLIEWVFLRSVPVPVEERESALVGGSRAVEPVETSDLDKLDQPGRRGRRPRSGWSCGAGSASR